MRPIIRSIDLNADLGEHDGAGYEHDDALLAVVSSASIACGGHAGNTSVMEETARRAAGRGVRVGAHPSYPDREGFGRRDLDIPIEEIASSVEQQLSTLLECAARAGTTVGYVKPHGALYNRAARDAELATAIVEVLAALDRKLVVLSLPGSEVTAAAATNGTPSAREAFIDRAYRVDGTLVPRSIEGAVIEDSALAAQRAVRIAMEHSVATLGGEIISVRAESLCVHSDSRNAVDIVVSARRALEDVGFLIAPFA